MTTRRARPCLVLPVLFAALAGCPPVPDFVTCEEVDACGTSGSTSSGDGETPTTSGSVYTVTGDEDAGSTTPDTETGNETLGTTGQPADDPPAIINGVVIPDYIDDNGVLTVEASTINAEGVHLLLDTGEQIELTQGRPGEFVGELPAFTGLDNGKRFAWLTPHRGTVLGETVEVDYVIALPPPGYEIGWQADGINGSVVAIDLLPNGLPVEFGASQEMGEPRCYLRRRDKKGKPLDNPVPVLAGAYCRAIDLKIDRETGVMHVLVERKQGDDIVWWAGELSAWGKGVKNIGTGEVGDTAFALAARPDVVAVCGSRAVPTLDKLDALAVLLSPGKMPDERTFDYRPVEPHLFTDTIRDCALAGEKLVLVGEARGRHDGELVPDKRDRLTIVEVPLAADAEPVWIVAGLDQGVQTRALGLDLDVEGRYHLIGYNCDDVCNPVGEVRVYAPGGKLVDRSSLGPLGSLGFGPHDIAWSPAGYVVVALGELQGQTSVFKVQAFAPGDPEPLWTFFPNDKQGAQLALTVAVGAAGEVYAAGIGDGHPAFARIGG